MKLQIPGKTYLVGEYSVLLGGAALGLATKPCFEVSFNSSSPIEFHPESPAGRYLKKHNQAARVSLKDPYASGGLGRSTAEYLSVLSPNLMTHPEVLFSEILKEYKSLHTGSGIDLAFQYFGQVCLAQPAQQNFQTLSWGFENLDFFIVSTGLKIKTHEHLQSLNIQSLSELPRMSDQVIEAFLGEREDEFIGLMHDWCSLLQVHSLTHAHSLELKNSIESHELIHLAKPCGALGADVLLVFFDKNNVEAVKKDLLNKKIKIQAHSLDLVEGVEAQIKKIRTQKQESLNVD